MRGIIKRFCFGFFIFSFYDQLMEVFAEIPEWDTDKKYTIENIRVYFEDKNEKIHSVLLNETLGQVLSSKR